MVVVGLALSFTLVGLVVGVGFLLSVGKRVSTELVRKIIHIGVSNWWFILIGFFDSLETAVIGPILFIVANSAAVLSGMANRLGISDRRRNLGLVYFPLSLLLLVLLGYTQTIPLWACGIGCLTMGYGDGLAAIIGKRWGRRNIGLGKTLLGTGALFVITCMVILGFSIGHRLSGLWSLNWWVATGVIALFASLLEAYTPYGLDNITVPVGTALMAFLLLGGL